MRRFSAVALVVPLVLLGCKGGAPAEVAKVDGAVESPKVEAEVAVVATVAEVVPAAEPEVRAALTLEQTVEAYVRAGGAGGDLEAGRALVDPRCRDDAKVWKVDPSIMMGSRITIATVALEVASQDGDKAVVNAKVGGDVKAGSAVVDEVMGQKAKVKVGGLEMSDVSLTQPVVAVRVDGRWAIGCDATK